MIASTGARSKRSINPRAKCSDSSSRPECIDSAPQQPWPGGTRTSHPSAASTRRVASFTPGKNTRCTHPATTPTRARAGPAAGTRSGSARVSSFHPTSGVSASI